jgi:hypothetical protein
VCRRGGTDGTSEVVAGPVLIRAGVCFSRVGWGVGSMTESESNSHSVVLVNRRKRLIALIAKGQLVVIAYPKPWSDDKPMPRIEALLTLVNRIIA